MTKYPFHKLRTTNPKEYHRLRWQEYKKTINRSSYFGDLNRTTYFSKRFREGKQPSGISSSNAKKARKFKRDKCEKCGSKRKLVIHHRNQNQSDNRPKNIQTLCSKCHNILHKSHTHFSINKPSIITTGLFHQSIILRAKRFIETYDTLKRMVSCFLRLFKSYG